MGRTKGSRTKEPQTQPAGRGDTTIPVWALPNVGPVCELLFAGEELRAQKVELQYWGVKSVVTRTITAMQDLASQNPLEM